MASKSSAISNSRRAAAPRAAPADGSYAGDLGAREAWHILKTVPESRLLDLRSEAEWALVGAPDLASLKKEPLFLEWRRFPMMTPNPDFPAQAKDALKDSPKTAPLLCLCRSGQRSREAARALTEMGFARAYNVAEGFEGPADAEGHRGAIQGWKAAGLPWRQG